MLAVAAYNNLKGLYGQLPALLTPEFVGGRNIKIPGSAIAERFHTLYNATSNTGKLLLLMTLVDSIVTTIQYVVEPGEEVIASIAALLLGEVATQREALNKVSQLVEYFVSRLKGVERTHAEAWLYPGLAWWYASAGLPDRAEEYFKRAQMALEELENAIKEGVVEKSLRDFIELLNMPNLTTLLHHLRQNYYRAAVFVYKNIDRLDEALKFAKDACDLATQYSDEYAIIQCGLLPRLRVVRGERPLVEEFKKAWEEVSKNFLPFGTENAASTFGEYVVALAYNSPIEEVKKELDRWDCVLKLHPVVAALTYGVLSLFDERYVEKAMEGLPEWARDNLPNFADVLRNAVEAGLFIPHTEIAYLAEKTLNVVYDKKAVNTLKKIGEDSHKLLLLVLVGLAHCKKGAKWGLELARVASQLGSQLYAGLGSRLFGELAKALESVTVGNCVTDEVLSAVYKLYYSYV